MTKFIQLILANEVWKCFSLKLSPFELNISFFLYVLNLPGGYQTGTERFLSCNFFTYSLNWTVSSICVPYLTVFIVGRQFTKEMLSFRFIANWNSYGNSIITRICIHSSMKSTTWILFIFAEYISKLEIKQDNREG